MKYQNVCLESFACTLPDEIVSTGTLEKQLEPVYSRLRLPAGRLELLTGITERCVWNKGTTIGAQSTITARKLIQQSGVNPQHIGALIHGSVCRDYLEPATACGVHSALSAEFGLPQTGFVYDVSNACLGIMSGIIQIADKIELGHIKAGIVVGTENSRALMETTVRHLNTDLSITRKSIKTEFASLTIGSGSAAVLLVHKSISKTGNKLLGGAAIAKTEHCALCRSVPEHNNTAGDEPSMNPLMQTDSETLMKEGVAAAAETFEEFLSEVQWRREDIEVTFCHQVGKAHQQLLFETLQLPPEINFSTIQYLGNTGSAALPTAAAIGTGKGLADRKRAALLGIGSGINVIMLGVEWNKTLTG
ncbi:MAG: 3-oxoacyl-ACP synthase III [Planctomycetaceae bacterium]|nr:3-oxoacyl-ACP synthase III [Planctomycetaceae bacterium]